MKYVATAPLWANMLGSDLKPTPEQAERWSGLVIDSPDHEGFVRPRVPIQIKVGEEFELRDEINKGMDSMVETAAAHAARQKAEKAAADKATADAEAAGKKTPTGKK